MAHLDWLALESDPEILNELASDLGLNLKWELRELYALEEDFLADVDPVALILLFPDENFENGSHDKTSREYVQHGYLLQQIAGLGNACGTIAIIHAIANNMHENLLQEDSTLFRFIQETKHLSPVEKGKQLAINKEIHEIHHKLAMVGRNPSNDIEEKVDYHYTCFVPINGILTELDGCKPAPVNWGNTSRDSFLRDSVKLIQSQYFQEIGGICFTLLALCPKKE